MNVTHTQLGVQSLVIDYVRERFDVEPEEGSFGTCTIGVRFISAFIATGEPDFFEGFDKRNAEPIERALVQLIRKELHLKDVEVKTSLTWTDSMFRGKDKITVTWSE